MRSDGNLLHLIPRDSLDARWIDHAAEFQPRELSRAIVYIAARWSSPSLQGLRFLGELLSNAIGREIPFLVLDADAFDEVMGVRPEGWNETLWIKDGRVVHAMTRFTDTGAILDPSRDLLP